MTTKTKGSIGALIAATAAAFVIATTADAQSTRTPVYSQIAWAVKQVNGQGLTLTNRDVARHFAPSFLKTLPAAVIVQAFGETRKGYAPITVHGFAGRPTATSAIALLESRKHQKFAMYATVERRAPHRLTGFEITERPGLGARAVATAGPYTGAFPVGGGRTLFLNCAGDGPVTVVLEAGAGGGSASWQKVQRPLEERTRTCSYDRANLPGGSSDPAPKPQTAGDIVRDLHRALEAAGVPKPYVFVGHSNGGLFARLYATDYPADVAGLVLVDSVSEEQPQRERTLFKQLMKRQQWVQYLRQLRHKPPFVEYVGDEQVDMDTSYRQMRAAAAARPLKQMPLVVISHGLADPMPHEQLKGLSKGVETMWQAMQRDLTKLVPGGERIVATHSHHQIPVEDPSIIVETLIRVVARAR